MGAPTLCCCAGGCNGWNIDGAPATGFGDTSTWGDCNHCDDIQNSEEDCCGPPTPQSMRFQASTKWMWSWHRVEQPDCLVCMGQNTPEDGGVVTVDPADWVCNGTARHVMYWQDAALDLGEVGSGAWWIDGGAIDMTVELDQELAAGTDSPDGYPPGCCAKYYYGKCDVTGPTKPGFSDNPFEYTSSNFATIDSVGAPNELEAFGRLELLHGGWAVTGYPASPPTLVLRATFSLFVCIRGAFNHYLDCFNGSMGTQMGTWITFVNQPVGGCSCGNGISLVDQIDWSSLWISSPGSGWNYAWELPEIANHSNSVSYTVLAGPECGTTPPSGFNCTKRTRCPVETFTVLGLDACCECGGVSFPTCNAPWGASGNEVADAHNCNVWNGRKNGPDGGWSYPFLAPQTGGTTVIQTGAAWGIPQDAYIGLPAEGDSWRCTIGYDSYPCNETTDVQAGCNSSYVIGGFQGGGTPQTGNINQFPACGLTDVQFDIGAQDPYA
jgi:hypothetical protein